MISTKNAQSIIKNALDEKGLKYDHVCHKLGIEPTHFLKYLNGEVKLSSAEFISMCIYLKLYPADFKRCNCI